MPKKKVKITLRKSKDSNGREEVMVGKKKKKL